MDQATQAQVNDQIALTLGRQMIELIAAQAMIAALQRQLGHTDHPPEPNDNTHLRSQGVRG